MSDSKKTATVVRADDLRHLSSMVQALHDFSRGYPLVELEKTAVLDDSGTYVIAEVGYSGEQECLVADFTRFGESR